MKTIDYTVLASGLYLTEPLPANWSSLDLADIHLLCGRTVLGVYDFYDGQGVWVLIEGSAYRLQTMLEPIVARSTELKSAVKELHGSISSIHSGYSKQLASKQELYESVLASYHGLLARDNEKTITELTARVQYLEQELSEVGTSLVEIQVITSGALS